jgi:2-C-methyl-D-erythritol 4-phosphate cytidylyltransferase
MNKSVVIVAGGSGSRMNSEIPKQFLPLNGRPVLMHTVSRFLLFEESILIVLVLPEKQLSYWSGLRDEYNFHHNLRIVTGGETRFHSVQNGLREVLSEGIVAVHDGARPLVSPSLIARLFKAATEKGNAVPYTLPSESIRVEENGESKSLDRSACRLIQTPQCFRSQVLKEAYQTGYLPQFTDEASVAEYAGEKIHLVEGEAANIKITGPQDLFIAEALMRAELNAAM